ncbi:hypothetical protein U1Q18_017760 [Sarracenia purpurea var. burkii]
MAGGHSVAGGGPELLRNHGQDFVLEMESSRPCSSCRQRALVSNDLTGYLICSSCGTVQELDNFQQHFDGISGPTGTFVHTSTAKSDSIYNSEEMKVAYPRKTIRSKGRAECWRRYQGMSSVRSRLEPPRTEDVIPQYKSGLVPESWLSPPIAKLSTTAAFCESVVAS